LYYTRHGLTFMYTMIIPVTVGDIFILASTSMDWY